MTSTEEATASTPAQQSPASLPPLGFISVEVIIHRPPGDPFNEATWPFPLIRERAKDSKVSQVVSSAGYDDDFIAHFVDAGQRLVQRGAVGIITSCGFLAMAQPELSERLPVPVLTSALVQVPSIIAMLPREKKVGILTYDDSRLGDMHLEKLGIPPSRVCIQGAPADGHLRHHIRDGAEYVHEQIETELVQVAQKMMTKYPEIAAVCLECTNMPPFAEAIQKAIGKPVYDICTAGSWFYSGLVTRRPSRWNPIPKDTIEGRT
ncbi:hypothetical protein PFICI_13938 [Pestalotiopsis fici W106-1]|uniref:Aspartate/glutamate racemase family protein n=1 Tax=Pestalotiopsis fici (strain W106-1 / CGMCC3.15140) TaxID=1229662 RepID=W3WLL7_PESFW|nr:uncharacterized protein PFICI_13938 [Pestalotiopsis fici W106-1]ETS74072.1 hypothetical protein PFICI_13938 [Pestalotiopsis fici W106-1]